MQLLPSNIFVQCKTAIWRSFFLTFRYADFGTQMNILYTYIQQLQIW